MARKAALRDWPALPDNERTSPANDLFDQEFFGADVDPGFPWTFIPDLVHWWRDGYAGGQGTDLAGGANLYASDPSRTPTTGSVNGHGTMVADGSDVIAGPDIATLDGLTGVTFFGCFKGPPGQLPYGTILGKLYATVAFHIGANDLGDRLIAAVGSTFALTDATSAADPFDNAWHRFIYRWDAANGGILYLDGVWQGTVGGTDEPVGDPSFPAVTEHIAMGGVTQDNVAGFDYHFTGDIANVGIVRRLLTTPEHDGLDAYLDAWVATATNFTLALRGIPIDARIGRAISLAANVLALKGAGADARSGRAATTTAVTIAPKGVAARSRAASGVALSVATMQLSGVRAEALSSRGSFVTAAVMALSGVRSPARGGRAVVSPGAVTIALVGARSAAELGRLSVASSNVLVLSGARSRAVDGRTQVSTAATIAASGIAVDARASSGQTSAAYTISLRGARAPARSGAATVAPGAVTIAVSGIRAQARASTGQTSSFCTIALMGVRADALGGRASVVPGDVAIALQGIATRARSGSIVVTSGGGTPITLFLAGIRADAGLGREVVTTAATLSLVGVRARSAASASRTQAAYSIAPVGVPVRARGGRASVAAFVTLALRGVPSKARAGRSSATSASVMALVGVPALASSGRIAVASSNVIALSGVRVSPEVGNLDLQTAAIIAPAGIRIEARPGLSGLLLTTGQLLRLTGIRVPVEFGRLVVYEPGSAVLELRDRAFTRVQLRSAPFTTVALAARSFARVELQGQPFASVELAARAFTRIELMSDFDEYNVGDTVELFGKFKRNGVLTDPSAVAVEVKRIAPAPPGTTTTYTWAGDPTIIVRDAQGDFRFLIPCTEGGKFAVHVESTGAAKAGEDYYFTVKPKPT